MLQFIWHVLSLYATFSVYMASFQFIWHVFSLYGMFSIYMACFQFIWHVFSLYGMCQNIWHVLVYMVYFQFIWHVFKLYGMAFLDPKNVFCHQQTGFRVFFGKNAFLGTKKAIL